MMIFSVVLVMNEVICDWLDVTYSPDDIPLPELRKILIYAGFTLKFEAGQRVVYTMPGAGGSISIIQSSRFGKVSLSGGICSLLRTLGLWCDVLAVLSSCPHKVTRLDAALDVPTDAADVISALRARYPTGQVALSRKALPVTTFLTVRPDGVESGTYYVGHRTAARATARVYDKRLEQLQRWGRDIGHELTRYEVTARKDYGATLRDALEPAALFWHIASPALIYRKPEGVAMWEPYGDLTGWEHEAPALDPYAVIDRRVEFSAELAALADVADELGAGGRLMLLRRIATQLGLSAGDVARIA